VTEGRLAKKAAGAIFGRLDLSELETAIEMIVNGNMKGHQIRMLLRDHIPHGYDISSDAMRNFRERALKYYLEEKPIDVQSADKLLKFQPLDESEAIVLPNTDLCRQRVRELMQQVMQGKDGGWKAKSFLESLKNNMLGFDYCMKLDETDGSPTALVWITPTMRKAWIRYGNVMFADMMKRKMNSLHWPYVSLVGLDNEKRVVRFCECLCLEEELEYYAWAISSLAVMEPRRALSSIRILFADGVMSDTILLLLGLKRPNEMGSIEGTDVVTDSFHLVSYVWPYELGQHLFDRLSPDLNAFVYAETREGYDSAYARVVSKLASDPLKLQYIKDYRDHPERFARYYVKRIPGNLGKTSSQPAEANHSSAVAHLGPGSTQDMVIQIKDLLSRQRELDTAHTSTDARYKLLATQKARELKAQNNLSEAEALCTLSNWGYNEYWKPMVEESNNYTLLPDQGDEYDRLHRNGTSMDSIRLIRKDGRCPCDARIEADSMCHHEYKRGGCVFDPTLFPERLFQPHKMAPIAPITAQSQMSGVVVGNSGGDLFDGNDDGDTFDDDDGCGSFFGNETTTHGETAASKDIGLNDRTTIPLAAPTDPTMIRPTKRRKAIGHRELVSEATKLANYASSARPQLREAIHTSLIAMTEIAKGESQEKPSDVVETLHNAMGSSTRNVVGDCRPKAGPEANKQGAPRLTRLHSSVMVRNGGTVPKQGGRSKSKCNFCSSTTCGNVSTCVELKKVGIRIRQDNLRSFVSLELNPSNARLDEKAMTGLVTSAKPVLNTLAKETKWLVIHSLHDLRIGVLAAAKQVLQESQTGVEVSCIGQAGVTIDMGNGLFFGNRMAYLSAVREWINKVATSNCGKTVSRVILCHNFHSPIGANASEALNESHSTMLQASV